MPFQSEKQRRYMHANLPVIANRWEKKYGLGGVAELNAELNSLPEYYLPFPAAQGGRIGFEQGSGPMTFQEYFKGKSKFEINKTREEMIREYEEYLFHQKYGPQDRPNVAQGGLIPAHQAGIYGLAEGGRIGFNAGSMLVAPTTDGSRPGYAYDDYEDMGFGDGPDMGSGSNSDDHGAGNPDQFNMTPPAHIPDYESGSAQSTRAGMPEEMANRTRELTKAQHEAVLGDHGDPMGNPEEQAKYARYVKYTAENQPLNKTEDLTFKEHWDNAPGILKYSLVLRGLYAAGKNLGEWARSKGWNWNSTTGRVTDNDGNEVSESDMQGATASQAPYMVSGTTPVNSTATQWYSTLGSSPSNPGAFDLTAQYAKAKAAVSQRLGNPTSVGQLAVNNSPFYNWLKDNSLNKGIL